MNLHVLDLFQQSLLRRGASCFNQSSNIALTDAVVCATVKMSP